MNSKTYLVAGVLVGAIAKVLLFFTFMCNWSDEIFFLSFILLSGELYFIASAIEQMVTDHEDLIKYVNAISDRLDAVQDCTVQLHKLVEKEDEVNQIRHKIIDRRLENIEDTEVKVNIKK